MAQDAGANDVGIHGSSKWKRVDRRQQDTERVHNVEVADEMKWEISEKETPHGDMIMITFQV